jgi:hypothetical protein
MHKPTPPKIRIDEKGLGAIHLYISTPLLTCYREKRREGQHVDRKITHV